ncbi:MAG: TenA family protein [Gemmatimonadota bacterium]|nr:TenA family protein [Gemmatimonadota bacterium]
MSGSADLHRRLWKENADLARASLEHPFVQGLAQGDLDQDAFRRYVAQDAFFLRAFHRAYALAAAKCGPVTPLAILRRVESLMTGVLDELDLHAGYAEELGIDLDRVDPHPATFAYTDFLLRTAWEGEPGEIFASMTPCMRLYAWLGQELEEHDHPGNPYHEWIRTYGSEEFAGLADEMESLLDELAEDTDAVRDAYRYAMVCERDFFSAPLGRGE